MSGKKILCIALFKAKFGLSPSRVEYRACAWDSSEIGGRGSLDCSSERVMAPTFLFPQLNNENVERLLIYNLLFFYRSRLPVIAMARPFESHHLLFSATKQTE